MLIPAFQIFHPPKLMACETHHTVMLNAQTAGEKSPSNPISFSQTAASPGCLAHCNANQIVFVPEGKDCDIIMTQPDKLTRTCQKRHRHLPEYRRRLNPWSQHASSCSTSVLDVNRHSVRAIKGMLHHQGMSDVQCWTRFPAPWGSKASWLRWWWSCSFACRLQQ